MLYSFSQKDVDDLGKLSREHELYIDCVVHFSLKTGPIQSIGEKNIIPVPFHVFNGHPFSAFDPDFPMLG